MKEVKHASYWIESTEVPSFEPLKESIDVDVAIIGGGITGITSAYVLTRAGLNVILIEASSILKGTTGHTTAKITAQHGVIYSELLDSVGRNSARMYYEANMNALQFIEKTIKEEKINCQFKRDDAYIYSTTDKGVEQLYREYQAYEQLKINGELLEQMPLTEVQAKRALKMSGQAQFHPLLYLKSLVEDITKHGGRIYEQTVAVDIEKGSEPVVIMRNGAKVKCRYVLSCSHFPFYEGTGLYSARLSANRSYAIAIETKEKFPSGMYINAEGNCARSLRSVEIDGREHILIVGENHKTGQGESTEQHYEALIQFAHETFTVENIRYRWSAQDLKTLDYIPYIGEISASDPNIMIATGYRKWGMSNGTAAALLFADVIMGKKHPYASVFTPSRFYMNPSLKNFFMENGDVVKHLIKGKLKGGSHSLDDLQKGCGAIIEIEGKRKGAYIDEEGDVHLVDPTCTHIGCEVEWNDAESTWDCPCHGSRFSYKGEVIEGPAEKPLVKGEHRLIDNFFSDRSGY